MRTLLISLFFISSFSISYAQTTAEQVDKQSYDAFFGKDYKSTIQIGNEALKQNIDFYFLRYRLGVSYYETKNYEQAVTHLEKAKATDSSDPVLLEYLYYAYVFCNRIEKSELLATSFTPELKAKVGYKGHLFKSVSVEFGGLRSSNNNKFKNKDLKGNNPSGRGTFYADVDFSNLVLENQFSPRFKILNGFSYVSNTSNDLIQQTFPTPRTDSYTSKNNYFQWNILASYFLKDWTISAGVGLYNASSYYVMLPPPFAPNGPVTKVKTTTTDYSASVSVGKRFKYFQPNLSLSYTNLANTKTMIAEGSVTYYPFGNVRFYGNSKVGYVSNTAKNNTVFSQLLGVHLIKNIWLEGFGAYGNHQNYISENGFLAFNTPNKINWYAGSNLNFFFKHFDVSLGYGIQERESSYETSQNPVNVFYTNYKYNYNLFKTKIVWKF